MATIGSVTELEQIVGERPPASDHKVIGLLDEHCAALVERSALVVLGTVAADGSARTRVAAGATVIDPTHLGLGSLAVDDLVDGAPVGALVLVPGYGETLRVNGRLRLGDEPQLEVAEAFVHCAKAVIRSKLWADAESGGATESGTGQAGPGPLAEPEVADVLAQAPFVALSTFDGAGGADVSPKGDPAGFVQVLDDRRLAVPDRPGNLRTDTFRNLLLDPTVGLVALVPGDDRVLEVRGRAHLSSDEALLATMAVNGRTPKVALVIDVDTAEVRSEAAVGDGGLWDPARRVAKGDLPRATRIWLDHIALAVAGAEAFFPPEDVVHDGIETDYRTNLY